MTKDTESENVKLYFKLDAEAAKLSKKLCSDEVEKEYLQLEDQLLKLIMDFTEEESHYVTDFVCDEAGVSDEMRADCKELCTQLAEYNRVRKETLN
jgi:hypothetical protein